MGERKHICAKKLYEPKKFNNLKEVINNSAEEFGNCPAFKFKTEEENVLREFSYKEYVDDINGLGTSLISIGLKDKRIGLIGENRYEWELSYLSITCGTGIIVPLDKSLPENEIISSIERSEIEAIFYTNKYNEVMEKVKNEKIGKLKFFISMDAEESTDDVYSFKELVKLGKDLIKHGARSYLDAEIDNDKMAIMLFTSGTTSKSKIVALSHKNICTNLYDISSVFDVNKEDTLLSFLPLHHTFESTVGFLYPVSVGASIAFCEGIRHIAANIKEYKATVMIAVPLLFESMYKQILKNIEKQRKMKKVKFGLALSNSLYKVGIDVRRKIFKEIHDNLGGKLRLFVAGGAAFNPEAEKGLNELGVETYQGYGLTESSPVIASEHKTCTKLGSIGQLFPSLEGKIIEPNEQGIGELAVKGDSIMLEYYGNEEATKETLQDGWLLTGDLAYFDKDDYIFITGRKKSVIVLKNGKNIYPEELEILLNDIPGVKESFVYGKPDSDDKDDLKICAKIVYDKEICEKELSLKDEKEIKDKLWKDVKNVNRKMPTYKYIKEISVTEEELIKTTTLKVKRFEEIKRV
jgi:long-chain acyl-CoA synthetase